MKSSADEKERKRLERNRLAARASREKHKKYVQELETESGKMRTSIFILQKKIDELRYENAMLARRVMNQGQQRFCLQCREGVSRDGDEGQNNHLAEQQYYERLDMHSQMFRARSTVNERGYGNVYKNMNVGQSYLSDEMFQDF
ncbi:hypothetical protein MHBO_001258 [Bonamia ostreae]|uniref:BZIP domain-containing protein n=1 Tax=Bonamia ostreae TaxID=126728 RepID=A0ABV2AIB8_9EUKA